MLKNICSLHVSLYCISKDIRESHYGSQCMSERLDEPGNKFGYCKASECVMFNEH